VRRDSLARASASSSSTVITSSDSPYIIITIVFETGHTMWGRVGCPGYIWEVSCGLMRTTALGLIRHSRDRSEKQTMLLLQQGAAAASGRGNEMTALGETQKRAAWSPLSRSAR
jgi:hypothetical protein